MRWLITIPTVRDKSYVGGVICSMYASCTKPTDFFVLDGNPGVAPTMNYAQSRCLDLTRHKWFVSANDDVAMPYGWQDDFEQAFEDVPGLGLAGPCWLEDKAGTIYMVEVNEVQMHNRTSFRPVNGMNVGGAFMVMPAWLVPSIPPYPWTGKTRHQVDIDGFICNHVKFLGHKIGYVVLKLGRPKLLDAPEWDLERKQQDIQFVQTNPIA